MRLRSFNTLPFLIFSCATIIFAGSATSTAATPSADSNSTFAALNKLNITDEQATKLLGVGIRIDKTDSGLVPPQTTQEPIDSELFRECVGKPTPIWASWGVATVANSPRYLVTDLGKVGFNVELESRGFPTDGDAVAEAARLIPSRSCFVSPNVTVFENLLKSLNEGTANVVGSAIIPKNLSLPKGAYAAEIDLQGKPSEGVPVAERVLYIYAGKGKSFCRYRLIFIGGQDKLSESAYRKLAFGLVQIVASNLASVEN